MVMPDLDEKQDKIGKNEAPPRKPALFQTILKYSDSTDMFIMALGSFGCFADGSSTPLIMLLLSRIMNRVAIRRTFTLHDINEDALSLIYLAVAVGLGAFLGMVYGKLLTGVGWKIYEAYGVAGGIAEQAFSSIRTVYSYVGESRTNKSYSAALERSLDLGITQGLLKGLAIGSGGIGFAVWSFQAWYGSVLVIKKGETGGNVFTAGVCIVVGGLLWQCPWKFPSQCEVLYRGSHCGVHDIRND